MTDPTPCLVAVALTVFLIAVTLMVRRFERDAGGKGLLAVFRDYPLFLLMIVEPEDVAEVTRWLADSLPDRHRVTQGVDFGTMSVHFRTREDAALFKLFWHERAIMSDLSDLSSKL